MKRLFLTLLLSTSFLAIIVTSCGRGLPYWELDNVHLYYYASDGSNINNSDSLQLSLGCSLDYLASSTPYFNHGNNPFIATSLATQPPINGYEGSRDPIRKVKVYSNNTISSYAPNTDLSPIIITRNEGTSRLYNGLSPEMINEEFDKGTMDNLGYLALIITERPVASTKHVFTIELETKSGKMFTAQTDTITWN